MSYLFTHKSWSFSISLNNESLRNEDDPRKLSVTYQKSSVFQRWGKSLLPFPPLFLNDNMIISLLRRDK